MNGLQATVAITNPNQGNNWVVGAATAQDRFGLEGKVVYNMANGKVWVSGSSYDVTGTGGISYDATAMDIGTNLTSVT